VGDTDSPEHKRIGNSSKCVCDRDSCGCHWILR